MKIPLEPLPKLAEKPLILSENLTTLEIGISLMKSYLLPHQHKTTVGKLYILKDLLEHLYF